MHISLCAPLNLAIERSFARREAERSTRAGVVHPRGGGTASRVLKRVLSVGVKHETQALLHSASDAAAPVHLCGPSGCIDCCKKWGGRRADGDREISLRCPGATAASRDNATSSRTRTAPTQQVLKLPSLQNCWTPICWGASIIGLQLTSIF